MKNVLVLCLIVGFVGVSNAGLHLIYDDTISIYSSEPLVGGIQCYIGMRGPSQIFSWDNPVFRTSGAPISQPLFNYYSLQDSPDAITVFSGYNLGVIYIAWGDAIFTPNPAGFWCSPVRSPIAPMSSENWLWQIELLDDNSNVISTLNFLPEPCTLLLLGLGGLLIRKRTF